MPNDVGPADELIDREGAAGLFYPDVLEEFLFPLWVRPPEEEFDLKDVALEGEGADGLSPLDEGVLTIFPGGLQGVLVTGVTEEGKGPPDRGADGGGFEIIEFGFVMQGLKNGVFGLSLPTIAVFPADCFTGSKGRKQIFRRLRGSSCRSESDKEECCQKNENNERDYNRDYKDYDCFCRTKLLQLAYSKNAQTQ